jgi:hypothetical protein
LREAGDTARISVAQRPTPPRRLIDDERAYCYPVTMSQRA